MSVLEIVDVFKKIKMVAICQSWASSTKIFLVLWNLNNVI